MNRLLAIFTLVFTGIVAAEPAKDAPAKPAAEAKPLEEVLATEKDPNGKHVMVQLHLLVHNPNGRGGMSVKFIDAKTAPNANVKKWDPKLSELKPETTILVTGELHFGAVKGGTSSLRYKVAEISGKKYNDHRHWRTDTAIYIINPTYEIVPAKN